MLIRRVGDWVLNHLVQDVPEEIGLCEFDCRRADCYDNELKTCQRLRERAQGELMPADPGARSLRA